MNAACQRSTLDDPRHVPYLMVRKDQRSEKVIEVVRVCAYSRSDSLDWTGWLEVKRTDGTHVLIRTIKLPLPRNGGRVSGPHEFREGGHGSDSGRMALA
jgi:hypothetical protein